MTPESIIKKTITDWLSYNHIKYRVIYTVGIPDGNGGYRKNPSVGVSDIIGTLYCGVSLYIEVKDIGKKITHEQAIFINEMINTRAIAFVAYSLDDVKKRIGKCAKCDCYQFNGKCPTHAWIVDVPPKRLKKKEKEMFYGL